MKRFRITLVIFLVFLTSLGKMHAQDVIITNVSSTSVSCGNGSDGTLSVSVSGGIGQYSYLLVKGALPVESFGPSSVTSFTFTGHVKYTNYLIIVSDEDDNTADGIAFGTIDGSDPISITNTQQTDITCNGALNGTITVAATGEHGNFIFDLTGPENQTNETGSFSGLQQGDYTVTVSDKDGCPSTDVTPVLTITNPTAVSITIDAVTDVTCFGDNSGSIGITPSGGVPGGGSGYTYAWTGPNGFTSNAEDISNLEAGDYFVTVMDGNMCPANAGPVTVNQPGELTATLTGTTDATCYGGNNGGATMTPGGGMGGYSYSWDGQTTGLISTEKDPVNLLADTYDFTLFDAGGCSKTFLDFAIINEPAVIDASVISTTDVSCPGASDGSATITPMGGTAPYTFSWTGTTSGYTSSDQDPINMPADAFNLTITDAKGCSRIFSGFLTISEPSPITVTVNSTTKVSCFGEADGGADLSINGGTPLYTTTWSGRNTGHSSSGETPGNLLADNYDISITDANGCTQDFPSLVTITEPAEISVIVDNVTAVECNGAATGVIEITPSGGTPVYLFSWTGPNGFTANTEDISNLEAGDYNLTITDANGCIKAFISLATVTTSTSISGSFILSEITCSGLTNGAIQATVSGGTPNYAYSWTGPSGFTATTEDISGLAPGSYQLTVTDIVGCTEVMPSQLVSEPDAITATTSKVDIDCFGANNGSIDLTSTGGVLPHLFVWTGPGGYTGTTEDISNLGPGSYSVTITDANNCIVPFPNITTLLEPGEIEATPVITDISCGGLTDGAITITVTGGTLPYNYDWSGPGGFVSTDKDLSDLAAGTYDLTITDGNGCIMNFPGIAIIIEPTPITASLISQTDILCNGDASGSITIDVSGGTTPLLFDWTSAAGITVSTDEDPSGLPAGTYSLTITDSNGCSVSYPDLATLIEPPELTSSLTGSHITCYGNNDGTIGVTATGGISPYEYSRNGDLDPSYQPGSAFTGLGPGFYTIWTRDANRCTVSDTITIIEPEEIQVLSETRWGQNFCYGDSSGSISIDEVTGGIQPYEYSINNGIDFYSTNEFHNLPAGDYQTVIRDVSGCLAFGNLNVITQPSPLKIDSYIQEDITTCYDAAEGRIVISGAGGFGNKTYLLDGTINSLTGDFQNVPGGRHIIKIADQNGCNLDTSIMILAPPEIVVDNITLTDVTGCSGAATGAVTVTGSGGTGSITYSLDGNGFQPLGSFSGLLAGNHTITLKDDHDCTADTVITLSEPAPIVIDSEVVTPITCTGAANGIIVLMVSGGTVPLTYTLNPGGISNSTGTFTDLSPGIYTVSADDAAGCGPVLSSPLNLTDPPLFFLDSVSGKNISCNGAGDGTISIYSRGGTPPYEYSIDNQGSWAPDSTFTGLTPNTYEVYTRDANLCSIYGGSITLSDPALLTIAVSTTDITQCSGDTTGVIEITGGGGTGILLYSLNGIDFDTSHIFNNLPSDNYTAYIQDEGGCSVTQSVTISEPAAVLATITKTDATFGNLGSITFTETSGGIPPYEYSIDGPGGPFSTETVYSNLGVGPYHAIARDANGCSYEEMIDILDVLPLDVVVMVTNVSCFGETDGVIEMVPQDAEGAVEYSIDSGITFVPDALFGNLTGNTTYNLVARDDAGKVFTGTATITEPSEINLSRMITPAECNVFSETGAIDITVSGGTPDYTYLWSDGSTEEDRNGLLSGTYTLLTTDAANCTRTDTILVNSLIIVDAYAGADTTICYGASIKLNGLGGNTPSWSPVTFLSDPDIANPIAQKVTETTSYVLTISEEASAYGCFNTDTVTIAVFPLTGLDVTLDTFIVLGASIQLEATGGPFSSYRWDPASGLDNNIIPNPVATPQQSTRYTVYALNDYNCEEHDSVFVEVIEDLMAYNVFSPNTDGINDFFDIRNADRFPEMVVEVYSRWGALLFQTVGYDDGSRWDGTSHGKSVPMGTYYYVIIPYKGAKPITGNVTIIR